MLCVLALCSTFRGHRRERLHCYTSAVKKRHIHRDPWELLSAKVACLGFGRALRTGGNGVPVRHVHLSMKRAQATESHQCERRLLQLISPPASGHLLFMVLKKIKKF